MYEMHLALFLKAGCDTPLGNMLVLVGDTLIY
jgi:hypothetical protein